MSMNCATAICQTKPILGDVGKNLENHLEWVERAGEQNADLVVFPELSLTGYFLRDLVQEIALPLHADPVQALVKQSKNCSIVFGFVEESSDHRFYNSIAFAEDGELLNVHRKVHLPDYGIFEEGRYFAAGDQFEIVRSRLGNFGLLVCEDAWHFPSSWLQFLQGAEAFILPSASPARGIDTDSEELTSHRAWNSLTTALSTFLQSWVVHAGRVGFEDGAMYWGGSSVCAPNGQRVAQAPAGEEHLLMSQLLGEDTRRARAATPLLRDAKPDLVRIHLARLLNDPDALPHS